MSKAIVVYQSKYGSTKKYARWLAEKLDSDLLETNQAMIEKIEKYDLIIFGGGIYASGIAGLSFLKKNYDRLKEKKIMIFAVGASPFNERAMEELKKRNLPEKLAQIPIFYCRGAWRESAMTVQDRLLCGILKKTVAKKDPAQYEPWEAALIQTSGSDSDWTDKTYLNPIIEYVQA
ncbi:MAG: flavodoxin domain-containing protein [Anaerolineaceae bacterium]